jgi:hypothetical protein
MHGSWNRSHRTGYNVVRVRLKDGVPTGEYQDFLTGFVVDDEHVWGRPVGVAVAHDGALVVSDDASNTLWRVTPVKQLASCRARPPRLTEFNDSPIYGEPVNHHCCARGQAPLARHSRHSHIDSHVPRGSWACAARSTLDHPDGRPGDRRL